MQNKKKVLVIFTGSMELGGIERSLLGLLDAFDYSKYEVDLFLYGHYGPLFHLINENTNILPEINELAYLRESLKTKIKNKAYYSAYRRIIDGLKKISIHKSWEKVLNHSKPKLDKHYDIALSFFQPFDLLKDYVKSDLKLGWIHTDYTVAECNLTYLKEAYSGLDYIVGVSEECVNTFTSLFPEYTDKTMVIENILSEKFVKEESEKEIFDREFIEEKSAIKLLSIGRFSHAKNFDNVPKICKLIREQCNVKWYLIGYGNDEALIREKIVEEKMEDYVIILGKKDNPYPYIKQCDLYIQPSRFEGKAVTVREAQMLGKPVVITAYPTAPSQLTDGVDGVIVPMDIDKCTEAIVEILEDKQKQEEIINYLKHHYYSNLSEVGKIYELML